MNASARVPFLILAGAVVAADQLSKRVISSELRLGEVRSIVEGAFNLTHTLNRGAAFSLMADGSSSFKLGLLILVSVLASVVVLALLWRSRQESRVGRTGLAMILGGALGNLWDRISNGSVIDFLDFYFRSYHWPVFNLADAAIVLGALLVLYEIFFGEERRPARRGDAGRRPPERASPRAEP
ncbi:MAG TPA: signal peptidase II [Candidatus Acidoferrales bacterium]